MSWPIIALAEVATLVREGVDPKQSSTTRYVGLEDIRSDGSVAPSALDAKELASTKFRFNDRQILFGKLRPYLRKIARPAFSGVCSTDIVPIHPGPRIDRDYLFHFLRTDAVVQRASSFATGANLPRLSPRVLEQFEVPLPPLEEQRRIAAILDQADALSRKCQIALKKARSASDSFITEGFGDPIRNEKRHPVVPLGDLVDPERPVTYGILKPGEDVEDGVPYVRVVDIKNGNVVSRHLRKTTEDIAQQYRRSTLREGDLLISIRGHVGRMAFTPPELTGANITQDTARLAITGADPRFVRAILEYPSSKRWMGEYTRGAAVQGINIGDLKRFPVIVPPSQVQEKFARTISAMETFERCATAQLHNLDALFASLQNRAFSGELTRSGERLLETA